MSLGKGQSKGKTQGGVMRRTPGLEVGASPAEKPRILFRKLEDRAKKERRGKKPLGILKNSGSCESSRNNV